VLLLLLKATESQFRTGWFIESVVSASLIVLAIRTRRPLVKSMPGKKLFLATLAIVFCTLILPWSWVGGIFGFTSLPPIFLILMFAIVALYLIGVEVTKKVFFKRMDS